MAMTLQRFIRLCLVLW